MLNSVWGTAEWFDTEYAPQLEQSIEKSILSTVVPDHPKCLGKFPTVTVGVNKRTLTEMITRFQCQGGKVLPLLNSMSLTSIAVVDRMCDECIKIDFSKTNTGKMLKNGMNVGQQWNSYGLSIEATSNYSRAFSATARILDTGNATCLGTSYARGYGSPNRNCPGGGLGWGLRGAPGSEAENCKPLGSKCNCLIYRNILNY
jgi:hypothetical protein